MIKKSVLISFAALISTKSFALHHTFKNVPFDKFTCESLREKITPKSDKIDFRLLKFECSNHTDSFTAQLSYESQTHVFVTNTAIKSPNGFYLTEKGCEEASVGREYNFIARTGSEAAISYCWQDKLSDQKPYALRIDGLIEKTKEKPQVSTTYVTGFVLDNDIKLKLYTALAALFKNRKIYADALSVTENQVNSFRISAHFYAPTTHNILTRQLGKYSNYDSCQNQANFLQRTMSKYTSVFCLELEHGTNLVSFEVETKALDLRFFEVKEYGSMSECTANLESIFNFYKDNIERQIIGIFCKEKDDGFHSTIIEMPLTVRIRTEAKDGPDYEPTITGKIYERLEGHDKIKIEIGKLGKCESKVFDGVLIRHTCDVNNSTITLSGGRKAWVFLVEKMIVDYKRYQGKNIREVKYFAKTPEDGTPFPSGLNVYANSWFYEQSPNQKQGIFAIKQLEIRRSYLSGGNF